MAEQGIEPKSGNQKPQLFKVTKSETFKYYDYDLSSEVHLTSWHNIKICKYIQLNKSFMNQYLPLKCAVHSAISYASL